MNVWPIVLVAGGLYALKKVSDVQTLNARFVNIDTKTGNVIVEIINPSDSSQSFDALVGDLTYNEAAFGVLDYRKPTNVPKLDLIRISLPIKLNIIGALQSLYNLVTKKGQGVTIAFVGNFTSNGITIPWTEKFEVVAAKK